MSDGPTISGGGSIAVETSGMLRAAALLEAARSALGELVTGTGWAIDGCDPGGRRLRLEEARARLAEAQVESERAASGLRTAALRYGVAEHTAFDAQRTAWAVGAATAGSASRVLGTLLGPGAVLAEGALVLGAGMIALTDRTALRFATTGEVQPQLDPVVLRGLGLALASLDDAARAALLLERPQDLLHDDPGSVLGTATIAGVVAGLLTRPAGSPLAVTRTGTRQVRKPADLGALVERIPDGAQPGGQISVERYDGPDGRRFIVYIAGTVTFAGDGGPQPFDSSSNLLGVADRTTDAQRAVVDAMQQAGIGKDEPVLLVGHSQGALTAVRVAQHAGYTVGGVVEAGGPSGQIVLPADVPRLAAEHDQDPVPELGGGAATGAAGLRRVVVTRSLPHGGADPKAGPLAAGVPSHGTGLYAETLREAEASGDPRMQEFRRRVDGFLDDGRPGDAGVADRYRARRVTPAPAPTAAAGSGR